MENGIVIDHLTKRFKDVTAVDDLSLTVPAGELFALLGVNGAGKTTTVRMLSCLVKPTSGDALVGGNSVARQSQAVKRIVGLSPQETAVARNLTAEENLLFMAGAYGLSRADARSRTAELTERLALGEALHRRAGTLSGGWQRRLSIAMALVSRPKVLFLDEPTLGLDVLARSSLWDVIRSLDGVTTVLTTHYMEEAEALADRVGVMAAGKLLCVGSPAELKAKTGTDRFEDAFVTIVKEAGAQ